MTASYPGSLVSFGTDVVDGDLILKEHVNDLRAEVVAIETALGQALGLAAATSVNVETLTANKTLTNADKAIQSLASNDGHDVIFPTVGTGNHVFMIVSRGSGNLVLKNAAGTGFGLVGYNMVAICVSDGIWGWYAWTNGTRVKTETTTSSPTFDAALYDEYVITALASNVVFAAPTNGKHGQKIVYRIKDSGGARGLDWNAAYRFIGMTAPTTTATSKTMYLGFIYNATDNKWDCVGYAQET